MPGALPRVHLIACLGVALLGCGGGPGGPECADAGRAACEGPAPSFATLHAEVIAPSCAAAGPSCHGEGGRISSLRLDDEQAAFDALRDGRVVPSAPGCSELVRRIDSDDPAVRMPPAAPLDEAARCSIWQWIAEGAQR